MPVPRARIAPFPELVAVAQELAKTFGEEAVGASVERLCDATRVDSRVFLAQLVSARLSVPFACVVAGVESPGGVRRQLLARAGLPATEGPREDPAHTIARIVAALWPPTEPPYIAATQALNPCPPGAMWLRSNAFPTAECAWRACPRTDWLLWYCARVVGPPEHASRVRLVDAILRALWVWPNGTDCARAIRALRGYVRAPSDKGRQRVREACARVRAAGFVGIARLDEILSAEAPEVPGLLTTYGEGAFRPPTIVRAVYPSPPGVEGA